MSGGPALKAGRGGLERILEGHLANKLGKQQAALRHVAVSRPVFPVPQPRATSDSAEATNHSEAEDAGTAPYVCPGPVEQAAEVGSSSSSATEPAAGSGAVIGAPAAGSSAVFIKTTKADDLDDYFDQDDVLAEKARALAQLIIQAKNVVVYTGAGISTAAKIPDYRSKNGIWTKLEKGLQVQKIELDQALPTVAHMAVSELVKQGICKLVVSTNVDGLHRRSGVPLDKLAELHGNCYRETCETCGKEYLREFNTIKGGQMAGHFTGRACEVEGCPGRLKDSIVNFGEALPPRDFQLASEMGQRVDLAIVLGSSMRVSPACNMPRQAVLQNSGKMVIVNLQKTPFEDHAWIHLHGSIDQVMTLVMDNLGLTIPVYHEED